MRRLNMPLSLSASWISVGGDPAGDPKAGMRQNAGDACMKRDSAHHAANLTIKKV